MSKPEITFSKQGEAFIMTRHGIRPLRGHFVTYNNHADWLVISATKKDGLLIRLSRLAPAQPLNVCLSFNDTSWELSYQVAMMAGRCCYRRPAIITGYQNLIVQCVKGSGHIGAHFFEHKDTGPIKETEQRKNGISKKRS